ncbi:MAG: sensor histidine kinase, partial [Myxococcota bacterium]
YQVTVTVAPDARVWADSEQLRQVLWNLLRNAFDASPPGETVDVSCRREGSRWRVDVTDRGVGIDPDIRDVLYEPFRTTKASGTGLGLALVHRIMESHGGKIQLRDAVGGGTCASVWWIAAEPRELAS